MAGSNDQKPIVVVESMTPFESNMVTFGAVIFCCMCLIAAWGCFLANGPNPEALVGAAIFACFGITPLVFGKKTK
ncbi:hypothetical protein JNK13_05975 [bacterium]|nr:hypothetical protein [bacterium]